MNLKEALCAMVDGKKVRKKTWNKSEYYFLDKNVFVDECEHVATEFSSEGDWEIYEENLETFKLWEWVNLHKNKTSWKTRDGNIALFGHRRFEQKSGICTFEYRTGRWFEFNSDTWELIGKGEE